MPDRHSMPHERHDLTGEHALTDVGQLILLVLFAGAWIADSFVLHATTVLNAAIPWVVRVPIGVALLILAGILARSSTRIIFGERRETPHVVRKGPFRWTRHPMYLSEVLLYLGLFLLTLSLAALAIGIGATLFLRMICRHEERMLLDRFGEEYRDYMREVPMWLPRVARRRR